MSVTVQINLTHGNQHLQHPGSGRKQHRSCSVTSERTEENISHQKIPGHSGMAVNLERLSTINLF